MTENNRWTPSELNLLRSKLKTTADISIIASQLGRSPAAVQNKAIKIGVKFGNPAPWWKRRWRVVAAVFGFIVTVAGLISSALTMLPRIQFDVSPEHVSRSPLPATVVVTNQLWPLSNVSFVARVCNAQNASGGKFIGLKECKGSSKGGGYITAPQYLGHVLKTDEKWPIHPASIGFNMDASKSDVRLVVRFWP